MAHKRLSTYVIEIGDTYGKTLQSDIDQVMMISFNGDNCV